MDGNAYISPERIAVSALMKPDTNLLISDEAVYKFLGEDFSINLIDHVPEELKESFLKAFRDCTHTPSVHVTKLRRCDGAYVDIAAVMRRIKLKSGEFIEALLFDVELMSLGYRSYALESRIDPALVRLINGMIFICKAETGEMTIYHGGKTVYSGSLGEWRDGVVKDGLIESGCEEMFGQICAAIAEAGGDGFFVTNTALFAEKGDKIYKPTSISFSVISSGNRPAYAAGIISDTLFPDRSGLDPLTGLYNKREIRRITDEVFRSTAEKGTESFIVIIDLDHFKEMNDTYGHLIGDKALVNTARIIKDIIGKQGFVGRIGGDEFYAVLSDYKGDHMDLRRLLRCIRSQIRLFFANFEVNSNVTCSIGTACYPTNADNYDDVFKLADHCLYLAKAKGRNRFVIYSTRKHGDAADIIKNSTAIQMLAAVTDEDKTAHLLSVTSRCNAAAKSGETGLVAEIMDEMLRYYDIDHIQYNSTDMTRHTEAGGLTADPFAFMRIYDTYKEKITQHGYIAIGNYMNAQSFLPDIAAYMSLHGLCSFFIVPAYDGGGRVKGIFAMTTYEQRSWSGFDINMLQYLCGLMSCFV